MAFIQIDATLNDYFNMRGAFSTGAPENLEFSQPVFLQLFDQLDSEWQKMVIDRLVDIAVGDATGFSDAIGASIDLLVLFADDTRYHDLVAKHLSRFESAFNDRRNIERWKVSQFTDSVVGEKFKDDYLYGLSLHMMVRTLNSKNYWETYAELIRSAASDHFRRSLQRNEAMYDDEQRQ